MRIDVSLSGQEKTIQNVLQWYEFQNKLSLKKKADIKHRLYKSHDSTDYDKVYDYFFGMSNAEFEDFFRELDYLAMLDLLASAEAAIKVDYLNRVGKRKPKNDLLKKYRLLYKQKGSKVSLESDILLILKETNEELKNEIGDFKGVLRLRNWLAHGRYWKPYLPRELRQYQVVDIYDITSRLLKGIGVLEV